MAGPGFLGVTPPRVPGTSNRTPKPWDAAAEQARRLSNLRAGTRGGVTTWGKNAHKRGTARAPGTGGAVTVVPATDATTGAGSSGSSEGGVLGMGLGTLLLLGAAGFVAWRVFK